MPKLDVVEQYLSILADDDHITFFHSHHDEQKDVLKIVTVYDEGKKYRLKFSVNGEVVINKRFSGLETVNKLINELLPEDYG
jgi:hypothetical protein